MIFSNFAINLKTLYYQTKYPYLLDVRKLNLPLNQANFENDDIVLSSSTNKQNSLAQNSRVFLGITIKSLEAVFVCNFGKFSTVGMTKVMRW